MVILDRGGFMLPNNRSTRIHELIRTKFCSLFLWAFRMATNMSVAK